MCHQLLVFGLLLLAGLCLDTKRSHETTVEARRFFSREEHNRGRAEYDMPPEEREGQGSRQEREKVDGDHGIPDAPETKRWGPRDGGGHDLTREMMRAKSRIDYENKMKDLHKQNPGHTLLKQCLSSADCKNPKEYCRPGGMTCVSDSECGANHHVPRRSMDEFRASAKPENAGGTLYATGPAPGSVPPRHFHHGSRVRGGELMQCRRLPRLTLGTAVRGSHPDDFTPAVNDDGHAYQILVQVTNVNEMLTQSVKKWPCFKGAEGSWSDISVASLKRGYKVNFAGAPSVALAHEPNRGLFSVPISLVKISTASKGGPSSSSSSSSSSGHQIVEMNIVYPFSIRIQQGTTEVSISMQPPSNLNLNESSQGDGARDECGDNSDGSDSICGGADATTPSGGVFFVAPGARLKHQQATNDEKKNLQAVVMETAVKLYSVFQIAAEETISLTSPTNINSPSIPALRSAQDGSKLEHRATERESGPPGRRSNREEPAAPESTRHRQKTSQRSDDEEKDRRRQWEEGEEAKKKPPVHPSASEDESTRERDSRGAAESGVDLSIFANLQWREIWRWLHDTLQLAKVQDGSLNLDVPTERGQPQGQAKGSGSVAGFTPIDNFPERIEDDYLIEANRMALHKKVLSGGFEGAEFLPDEEGSFVARLTLPSEVLVKKRESRVNKK